MPVLAKSIGQVKSEMLRLDNLRYRALRACVARSGLGPTGRLFSWLAAQLTSGYKNKAWIAKLHPSGYIAHTACVSHKDVRLGLHVYIGDRVTFYGTASSGAIELADSVRLYGDTILETEVGGSIAIGEGTHIQPRCQMVSALTPIVIGKRCEIAPACAVYSFDHAFEADVPVRNSGLRSRGQVTIGDDVWLGYGVVVLSGVTIGNGAVVGASTLVNTDVPSNAIAVGNPARVVGYRKPPAPEPTAPDVP